MPKFMVMSGTHSRVEGEKKKRVIYKKGDVIEATEYELRSFLDKFRRIGPPEAPEKPKAEAKQLKKEHRGGGKYNVVNPESGKPINNELLSSEDADALIEIGNPD